MTIGRESNKWYRCALAALAMMTIFTTANAMAGPQDYWATGGDGTTLVRIDKTTGVGTTIGSTGVTDAFATAFTPDGTLWTIFGDFPNVNVRLGKFDLSTGAVTQVGTDLGTPGYRFRGLEADNAGNLYGYSTDSSIFEINQSTGVATMLFDTGRLAVEDLAFDNTTGTLWALQFTGDLFTIDIANQTTSTAGKINGIGYINSIGFDSAGQMFVVQSTGSNSNFYSVDTTTFATTAVGNTGLGWVNGGDFEFGPQGIPLPAPALLAIVGFGCILIVRRRYFR